MSLTTASQNKLFPTRGHLFPQHTGCFVRSGVMLADKIGNAFCPLLIPKLTQNLHWLICCLATACMRAERQKNHQQEEYVIGCNEESVRSLFKWHKRQLLGGRNTENCVTPKHIQFSSRSVDVWLCPVKLSQNTVPSNDTRNNGFTSFLWLCTVCCSEAALPPEGIKWVSHSKAAKLTDKQLAKPFRINLMRCPNSVRIPIQQQRNAAFKQLTLWNYTEIFKYSNML